MTEEVKNKYREFEMHIYSKGLNPNDLLNTAMLISIVIILLYKSFS